jgi:hypothetical protein
MLEILGYVGIFFGSILIMRVVLEIVRERWCMRALADISPRLQEPCDSDFRSYARGVRS